MLKYNPKLLLKFLRSLDKRVLLFQALYEAKSGVITPATAEEGIILPNTVYIETGSYCESRCADCYIPVADRKQDIQLTDENIADIVRTSKLMNVNYITILGGEPFSDKTFEKNVRLVRDHPEMRFTVCTGSTELDDENKIRELQRQFNLTIAFSIDGPAHINDRIRGKGSHEATMKALRRYSDKGRNLAGTITTLRKNNWDAVTRQPFIDDLCQAGAYYFEYGPYYTERSEYNVSEEEYAEAILRLMALSTEVPAILFSNHFGQIYGYKSSLRNRIHSLSIDYNGNVYTARRGHIFGNINDRNLMDIILDPETQRLMRLKHVEFNAEAVGATDLRYPALFTGTLDRLSKAGVELNM
jgi:sulfatase maturation enzyme AslB (radical SAM superfamily)